MNPNIKYPKIAVIISCYNYESYIAECINSIIKQDYQNITIIVVDDGSSDNSVEIMRQIPNIKLITQPNKGQLGAFNTGFRALEDEEIIFFMDADDMMNPAYIKYAIESYTSNPEIDFMFCDIQNLAHNGTLETKQSKHSNGKLGFGVFRAYFLKDYLGHSTSTISIKRNILERILPLDLENDWKIRADDCIIWGASLVGANIYHLDFYGITYRIHGTNNHYGKRFDNSYLFKRELNIERLFAHIMQKNTIILSSSTLYMEFLSNKDKRKYIKIALLANLPLIRKILLITRILTKRL